MDAQPPRRTIPAKCAACERPLDSPLFCGSCRRLYPAEGLNYFELLGLDPRYELEADEVRTRYFELARDIHPDRLGDGDDETQQLSLRLAARLNGAFRVLLDPVLRAEYLLELVGGKSAADDKRVPQQVLMDTLTLREEIEEGKAAGDQALLDGLRQQVEGRFEAALAAVASLARELPGTEQTRAELRGRLNTIRYFRNLLEQL